MVYIDTSVLVAALTREAETDRMQNWLVQHDAGSLMISPWVITEFSSALSIKCRTGHLQAEHRAEALSMFNTLVAESFDVVAVGTPDFQLAARLADHHSTGLRAGDALHLAVACNHRATVGSLDLSLVAAAHDLGIEATLAA